MADTHLAVQARASKGYARMANVAWPPLTLRELFAPAPRPAARRRAPRRPLVTGRCCNCCQLEGLGWLRRRVLHSRLAGGYLALADRLAR